MKLDILSTEIFFPEALKTLPIWVLWRLEERSGRLTKVPYRGDGGGKSSPTDPGTWTTFDEASATLARYPDKYNGLGTVMSKDHRLIFIDIDHCLDPEGNTDKRADDILDAFTGDDGNLITFIELSQSGTGLHIITVGDIPRSFKNSKLNVEMYSDSRFCAMTGRAISAREPTECEAGIRYVFERYKTAKKAIDGTSRQPVDAETRRSDRWIIDHASARTESKFPALFAGDWSGYESQSEADLALCKILAFWTNNDPESVDRLFRMSGLYRAKWERKDYSAGTINKAIAGNDDTLARFQSRKLTERGLASLAMLEKRHN